MLCAPFLVDRCLHEGADASDTEEATAFQFPGFAKVDCANPPSLSEPVAGRSGEAEHQSNTPMIQKLWTHHGADRWGLCGVSVKGSPLTHHGVAHTP